MKLEILYNGTVTDTISAGRTAFIPAERRFKTNIIVRAVDETEVGTEGLVYAHIPDSDSYAVYKYTGSASKVIIPPVYLGKVVTAIYDSSFFDCRHVTSITMPESIDYIGSLAFRNCYGLTEITIPNNVKTIRPCAFMNCTSLTSIYLPDSVTYLGYSAFGDCSSLSSVRLSNRITVIELTTFLNCTSLTSLWIPYGITTIDSSAFGNCTKLEEVFIPTSITTITTSAFSKCTSLKKVYYEGSEEQWSAITIGTNNDYLINANRTHNYVPT